MDQLSALSAPLLQRPKAVLFDWDNTLIDSWHAIQDAQNFTLSAFGLPTWSIEETRERVRGSMRDSFPVLFGDRWREAGEVFYKRFAERHMQTLVPVPGAAELLEELASSGIYLGVVSNKKGDYLRKEVEHLGWSRFFTRVVGAFDAACDKPAADPIYLALDASGLEAGEAVWLVGDSDVDIECAGRGGCYSVLVRAEPPQPGEFGTFQPCLYVESCMALSNVIRSL